MEKKPRGWRRPEAPRKASGFIRISEELSGRRGRGTPGKEGLQGWELEMLGTC